MYKIYINDHPLVLMQDEDMYGVEKQDVISFPYLGGKKMILNCIDRLEKSTQPTTIFLHSDDVKALWTDFKSLFKGVKAAGGIVTRAEDEILFIHRMGRWDLPKGKRESDEKYRQTAIREVLEETGLACDIHQHLIDTRHTYRDRKGRRILKKTRWYLMDAISQEVTLQTEEQIDDYYWGSPGKFLASDKLTYESIRDVVRSYVDTSRSNS